MSRRRSNILKLQLESLESRMLLATGDAPVEPPPITGWESAVASVDPGLSVELLPYNRVLIISGSDAGDVTINLSGLPSSVVSLQISHFETVTLTGDADLHDLVLTDVKFADAGSVDLEWLFTFGVDHVKIEQAPAQIMLQGSGGIGTVGEITLLEAGQFSTDPGATIFALVKTLGLATTSDVVTLPQLFRDGTVYMNFEPENPVQSNSIAPVNIVTGTDFIEYFFATPEERDALNESPTIARSLAIVERVSLESMLSDPGLQAALGEAFDFSTTRVRLPSGPVLEDTRWIAESGAQGASVEVAESGETPDVPYADALRALDLDAGTPLAPYTDGMSPTASETGVREAVEFDLPTVAPTAVDTELAMSALSAALARLSDPFVQTVTGLQGRFSSYGDLVSARFTDQMRSDGRPVLLADARPLRHRQAGDMVIVNV